MHHPLRSRFLAGSLALFLPLASLLADPSIEIARHAPCNLFEPSQPVAFEAKLKGFPAGKGEVTATLADYDKKEVKRVTIPYDDPAATLKVDLGPQPRGYYTLQLSTGATKAEATLGVMEFVHRTAKEVRDGGYVFGLKWWGGVKNQEECLNAMTSLGLQWTRVIQNQGAPLTTERLLKDFPINAVIKVERFPKELYDEAKYGPMAEWEAKYGKGSWVLKSLPKKEPYQLWLREQLSVLPAEQQIFEIWNEPWDKMSPEDFATVSQWVLEVILKDRPNAIVGPNLLGNSSPYEYDARVIKAGGLKGMKMVALHPYGSSENREWLRDYRAWLKKETGTDMQLHITEFGSHSTPEGPAKRSEEDQANRVVRQALTLYAEGVNSLHPHWLGQSEANRTYLEDWFGFIRKNETPKPVLLAYANAARLIDATKYEGDLWYGPRVAAMLFNNKGVHTLALWTLGETPGATKDVEIAPGVDAVEFVETDGRSKKLDVTGGKLKLTLTEAPVYLVGVSPDMVKEATTELRADRWPQPAKPIRPVRVAGRMKTAPKLDGKFDDWVEAAQLALLNPKVAGLDASGTGYVSWDDQYLYVGVDIRDNEVMNKESRAKLYRHDSLELFVSTEPRESGSGFGPPDHQFFITPKSGEGPAIVGEVTDQEAGVVTDVKGAKYHLAPGGNGWLAEIALPWSNMPGAKPKAGAKLTLDMRVNDADTSHERFKLDPTDAPGFKTSDPSTWSYLELKD